MVKQGIVLKKGKEVIFQNRHLWIFSGAIASFPEKYINGAIYPIYDSELKKLGSGYFHKGQSLCGRILSFGEQDPIEAIHTHLDQAIDLRKKLIDTTQTTAFRLVNGEADLLPGLIIDQYGEYLVLQSGSLGIDLLKDTIVKALSSKGIWKGIYEKSTSASRKEEGLKEAIGTLLGDKRSILEMKEEGIHFNVDWEKGQKTGFFLDQREMRALVKKHAKGKRVLNCFSYSGGFSLNALMGGASHVDSVDISKQAIELLEQNLRLNKTESSSHKGIVQDAFEFLNEDSLNYDIVILDPPAFAKKKQDIAKASRGYREINAKALSKMPRGSLLLTCSCSYHINEELFQTILFQAARLAGREVLILSKHIMALDHPINLFHPESDYLKSLLLYIN